MALAKQCDICGAFFTNDVAAKRNAIAFVKVTSKGDAKFDNHMDCCPQCMSEIEACLEECRKRPKFR